jgi:hypothetical protein
MYSYPGGDIEDGCDTRNMCYIDWVDCNVVRRRVVFDVGGVAGIAVVGHIILVPLDIVHGRRGTHLTVWMSGGRTRKVQVGPLPKLLMNDRF